ncbi:hypothetical protein B843_00940 [Corynebacterium vitaeruminis DSM 20294]|uniref:Uncharacterized protein n=5 Tax=root TaxID=1 RepID=W5XY13_9CORY|nr:hypothetical protein B843_00940 [Corynebacterium vitaeruminis DSM 20294]
MKEMSALRAPRSMPQTSKIIVYQEEFVHALKAAGKVSKNESPYDVVQIRWDAEAETLQVCAVNAKATFVAYMSVEMGDVLDRDQVFEIEKRRIAGIAAMRFPKAKDEEPLLGLIVAESWIEITDESGLGIGVHKLRIPRSSEIALPGDPSRTIQDAAASSNLESWAVKPYPDQLGLISAVAKEIGGRVRLQQLAPPKNAETNPNRLLASSVSWSMTVTALPSGDEEDDSPTITVVDQGDLGFDDDRDQGEEATTPTTRIVSAEPPDGAA